MERSDGGSIFREQRAAKNQSLFREVNERIEGINESISSSYPTNEFVCECADESCTEPIALTTEEYEALRQQPNRFAVLANQVHVWPDVERVVHKNERYWVVEKFAHAGAVAV